MRRTDADVLVAGGGVAGLATTALFASGGLNVVCVDPVPPVTDADGAGADLRSTAFLNPALALLDQAGLRQPLEPHAAPLRVMRIVDAGGPGAEVRSVADFVADEAGGPLFGWNLPNWRLRREMAARIDALPCAELRAGLRVERVTARSSGAIVALSDGSQVRAALVIAADGRDSPVRRGLGIAARRWGYGQKAVVFTVAHEPPHEDVSTEVHRSGGPFTLVPLPDQDGAHRSAVVWMDAGPRVAALAALSDADLGAAATARSCGLLGALRPVGGRAVWPIVSQVADRLDGPRTALVAEAAHVLPPIGAQGLNLSLADIGALHALVAAAHGRGEDIGSPALLAGYHRARHGAVLLRVAGVDALNRASIAGSRPVRDLRALGLRALHGVGPLRRQAMRLGLGAPENVPAAS